MNRKEQIRNASKECMVKSYASKFENYIKQSAFISGAKWADKPLPGEQVSGIPLAVAEFTVTAEHQLMQRFKSMWGYTVPTIADLNDFPRLLRPILVAVDPTAPSVNISDDTTCLTALKAFICKAYGNEMSETASGEALAINPAMQQDIASLEKQKDKKTIA